jgi:hypothetical protein
MLEFIKQVGSGDTLLGCFYEFRYEPVVKALREKAKTADVRIIVDAKDNSTPKRPEAFPREENLKLIKALKFPKGTIIQRDARSGAIQHNKFMILLKGKGANAKPVEVWTGSTNLSLGGIHGQTNVGHWVRDKAVAAAFQRSSVGYDTIPGMREPALCI